MKECKICKETKELTEFAPIKKYYSSYCRSCNKAKAKSWYAKNRNKHNGKSLARYQLLRTNCITALGGKCQSCEVTDHRILCVDHKNGNGAVERKKYGTGTGLLYKIHREIKNGKHDYQLLCHNCNWIKALECHEL